MDLWDQDAIDLVGPAFVEFEKGGHGELGFIAVQGGLDWRSTTIEGKQAVEFSWQGFDEGDEVGGRGWAAMEPDALDTGELNQFFRCGTVAVGLYRPVQLMQQKVALTSGGSGI